MRWDAAQLHTGQEVSNTTGTGWLRLLPHHRSTSAPRLTQRGALLCFGSLTGGPKPGPRNQLVPSRSRSRSRPVRCSLSRVHGAQVRHVGHSPRPFRFVSVRSRSRALTRTTPSPAARFSSVTYLDTEAVASAPASPLASLQARPRSLESRVRCPTSRADPRPPSAANAGALPHPRSNNSRHAATRSRLLAFGSSAISSRTRARRRGEPPHRSRTVFASPLGRPPGLPDWPGLKPLPVMPPSRVVSGLFSAGFMCSSMASGAVDTRMCGSQGRTCSRSSVCCEPLRTSPGLGGSSGTESLLPGLPVSAAGLANQFRWSVKTSGNRLSIIRPTGRRRIVRHRKYAIVIQINAAHQPTRTK